jgi:hypothetical protein
MEKETPNYYAVIPAPVLHNKVLSSDAKILFAHISTLMHKTGYCFATNEWFESIMQCSTRSIIRLLSQLEAAGFITRELIYKEGSKEVQQRRIKSCLVVNQVNPIAKSGDTPSDNFEDNTIYPIIKTDNTPGANAENGDTPIASSVTPPIASSGTDTSINTTNINNNINNKLTKLTKASGATKSFLNNQQTTETMSIENLNPIDESNFTIQFYIDEIFKLYPNDVNDFNPTDFNNLPVETIKTAYESLTKFIKIHVDNKKALPYLSIYFDKSLWEQEKLNKLTTMFTPEPVKVSWLRSDSYLDVEEPDAIDF